MADEEGLSKASTSHVRAGGAQKSMHLLLVTKWHQLEDGKAYQPDSSGKSNGLGGSLECCAKIDS